MADDRVWSERVAFSEIGGFAYAPGELLIESRHAQAAHGVLDARQSSRPIARTEDRGSFARFREVIGPLDAIKELGVAGIPARPNHVLFAHSWFAPHAAMLGAFAANPFAANPFAANPFAANPFAANPFAANPYGCVPYSADGYEPNPLYLFAYTCHRPETAEYRATGWRPHSARPAEAPLLASPASPSDDPNRPSVVVIDTGVADGDFRPDALTGVEGFDTGGKAFAEVPDADGDERLDPVAGHGTFIAGIIERIAPGLLQRREGARNGAPLCGVHGLLNGAGDATEEGLAAVLEALLPNPPSLVNLSLGGYTVTEMPVLAEAVRKLQDKGTIIVASAGNDATCRPQYPAALPGVVSVGALGPNGPAPFTNWGPWVRACAPGVDVVSTFFKNWTRPGTDPATFEGWARWSGTSFAAPAVVGALARVMQGGVSGKDAVEQLIDNPNLFRIPGLGTVVNQI